MNAYRWGLLSQPHIVIASSMESAVKIVKDKYGTEPDGIEKLSDYVLIETGGQSGG